MSRQSVTILGSTGSIGVNTLDVMALHREKFKVFALTAKSNIGLLSEQCRKWKPKYAVVLDAEIADQLGVLLDRIDGCNTKVLFGLNALCQVSSQSEVDIVVAGIVGAAGLGPTLAAARCGKRLLLANKEALVMSGQLLMKEASISGAVVLPVDSEHNAIFQSLPSKYTGHSAENFGVTKIYLTASGGPFRGYTKKQLSVVSKQQALCHPNWSMGAKITVDSASMMNKGLEVIEACQLFNLELKQIEVVVHPESVIHSMVSYCDGSVLAQLGNPDMRTPIAHALAWPERIESGVKSLNLVDIGQLNFEKPDTENFPALGLAFDAQRSGGTAPTILNAANEVAVHEFLRDRVSFLQLHEIVERTLNRANVETADDLETILNADLYARQIANTIVERLEN